jgi:hypothetical protein
MNSHPSKSRTLNRMTKAITLGISALALTGQIASANLTYDLRAVGPGC